MPWQPLPSDSKDDESLVRNLPRAKLYADEDIEDEVVEYLRSRGVNIKSARELGHHGKPDEWQLAYAKRTKRFLLTKNGSDFLDDRKFPWDRVFGVIVVRGDMGSVPEYVVCVLLLLRLVVPAGKLYEGSKIALTVSTAEVRSRSPDGSIVTTRLLFDKHRSFIWVEDM